jgi:hypothetical protein
MYQPALRPDQIRSLCLLKCQVRVPMTRLVQEAVDAYLARFSAASAGASAVAGSTAEVS